jgi:LPS O-antigen subunit length determinant protein (WzzB/FepE family)
MTEYKNIAQVPSVEDEIDLFQLVETLWRQKILVGLIVLGFVAMALIYIYIATPVYEVKMEIRPGITHYGDGFKKTSRGYMTDDMPTPYADSFTSPVKGWTIDDIIGWVNNKYYYILLPDANNLKLNATKSGPQSQTVTLSLLTPKPQEGVALLDNFVSRWNQYYTDEGHDQNIASSKLALKKAIQFLHDQMRLSKEADEKDLDLGIHECGLRLKACQEELALINQQHGHDLKASKQEKQKRVISSSGSRLQGATEHSRNENIESGHALRDSLNKSKIKEQPDDPPGEMTGNSEDEFSLMGRIDDLNRRIEMLKIKKEEILPAKRRELERLIDEYQTKLHILAPVEKVTEPVASRKPVSPRKVKVLVLAMVGGGFLGIFTAFLLAAYQSRKERRNE